MVVLSPDVATERTSRWWSVLPRTTWAAMGAVLAWFMLELGPFLGQAPDLDGMVALRDALVLFNEGFHGLIASADGTGIHPPLSEVLDFLAFSVLGADPRSQQLMAIPLFLLLAALVERLLARRRSAPPSASSARSRWRSARRWRSRSSTPRARG